MSELLSTVSILDVIIFTVFVFYAFEGFEVGFVSASIDFLSFVSSFIIGLLGYSSVAFFLTNQTDLSLGFAKAIGFFVCAFVSEILLSFLLRLLLRPLFSFWNKLLTKSSTDAEGFVLPNIRAAQLRTINKLLGIIPGFLSAFVLLSFLLTLVVSLPLSPQLKRLVSSSTFGQKLISSTTGFEKNLNAVFGGAISDTLNFLTVEPEGNQLVNLRFSAKNPTVDDQAEQAMFAMVNNEREKAFLSKLSFDESLTALSRAHAKDMLGRGYFSHYTPEGLSPFDRMAKANISFIAAGENLAFAPNVTLAMQGLMQSPGHRANILSKDFGRVGIGVLDAGIYGEMFVQEFKD